MAARLRRAAEAEIRHWQGRGDWGVWSYCDLPQSGVRFQHCDALTTLDSGLRRNPAS